MSVLNQSGEEPVECPLCMEALEVDDLHFYPCTCGYQICRFCWNRIREGENGLCPACRKAYPENPADFTPLSQEQVAAIKTEKKAREQKRRNKTLESRRALANVRVVQKNLVFVVGLPVRLADPEILKRQEYFGKYGKIHKVVINQNNTYAGAQASSSGGAPSASAYVTYVSSADALRAIQGVNNVTLDGRVLKGSLGTTKYCANFMKNQPCPKPDCMYLHELGDPKASFTKEEMHAGLHQVYERKLHNQLAAATRDKLEQAEKQANSSGNSSTNGDKSNGKDGTQSNFIPTTVVTSNINVVNSSKSNKKEQNNSNGIANGKEAWPSLGSSPPSDSPARKQSSPKPQSTVKSQENGTSSTSESSSPTQLETQSQAQKKTKDTQEKSRKESTNGKKKDKSKHKSNSISVSNAEEKPSQESKSKDSYKNSENNAISESFKTSNYNKSNEFKNSEFKNSDFKNSEFKKSEFKSSEPFKNSDYKSEDTKPVYSTQNSSVFENDAYLANELDELESDRHSLLENHDLLENSDHSLLDDDNTHNLLNDANNEIMLMQRHREMLAGLIENKPMLSQIKNPMLNGMNGYGLLDRDMGYLDRHNQMNNQLDKDLLLRDRSQSELLMRQNEMLARQHNHMEPSHYNTSHSIGMDNASELLGANYHTNPNMLPPFGMRVDTSMNSSINNMGGSSLSKLSANMPSNMSNMNSNMSNMNSNMSNMNSNMSNMNSNLSNMGGNMPNMGGNMSNMGGNMSNMSGNMSNMSGNMPNMSGNMSNMSSNMSNMSGNLSNMTSNMANMGIGNLMGGYMLHNQQMMNQQMQNGFVNGFDAQQNNEGRYLAENMDKFFTDFHKAQQLRLQLNRGNDDRRHFPQNMLSAVRLEMEHKQRSNNVREQNSGRSAAGDGDDDLDFDPFKETQKAFAELMETEMIHNQVSSGDNMDRVRRTRMAPPGFSAPQMNSVGLGGIQRQQTLHGFPHSNSTTVPFSDWTAMDPAIMSVNFSKNQPPAPPAPPAPAPLQPTLSQQELFARFNMQPPNGMTKMHPMQQWQASKLSGWGQPYNSIPMPPGFAPAKAPPHPAECIDAK